LSARPLAFVFAPGRRGADVYLKLVAFGEREARKGDAQGLRAGARAPSWRYPDKWVWLEERATGYCAGAAGDEPAAGASR
jgi:hypothetical protein